MKFRIRRLKISAFILSFLMLISLSSCALWLNEYFGFTNPYSQNKKNDEPGTSVEDSNRIQIGDVVMSDGSYLEASAYSSYGGTANPVGVICKLNEDGKSGLMLGLSNSSAGTNCGTKIWAPDEAIVRRTFFAAIQGTTSDGDIDGSDNWEEVCKVDTERTADPAANYPAFNYALTYAATAGLEGTEYADGWYMPTVYELYNYVYQNKKVLNASLTAAGGATLAIDTYWSSSQYLNNAYCAWYVYFYDGYVDYNGKGTYGYVCCLRAF